MTLTLERAALATGGEVYEPERFPARLRVVTDTRTIERGDTFLALRGERFDGHDYIGAAVAKGAAALIVERGTDHAHGIPALIVADTKRAYVALATAVRGDFLGAVVGITGSAGKTTTKHVLAQLLRAHFGNEAVLAAPANENNELGVSKLLFAAEAKHRVLVVEMGARHAGDVAELVQMARPHVGVLTNIGEAHLEIFGSRDALARTKWGLFSMDAQAVLNVHDAVSALRAASLRTPPKWFGAGTPAFPGTYVVDARTLEATDESPMRRVQIDLRIPGKHNHENVAAAVAAARVLGVPLEEIVAEARHLTLPPGRYERIKITGRPAVIFDAYNANMSGTLAALDTFAHEPGARRIAVLASMAELGDEAPLLHERVGSHVAASNVDVLLVGGEFADSLAKGAREAGFASDRIERFADNAAAVTWLRRYAADDDVVLLKGSRVYKLEEIIEALL